MCRHTSNLRYSHFTVYLDSEPTQLERVSQLRGKIHPSCIFYSFMSNAHLCMEDALRVPQQRWRWRRGGSVSSRTDSTTQAPSSPTTHPVQHHERSTEKKKTKKELHLSGWLCFSSLSLSPPTLPSSVAGCLLCLGSAVCPLAPPPLSAHPSGEAAPLSAAEDVVDVSAGAAHTCTLLPPRAHMVRGVRADAPPLSSDRMQRDKHSALHRVHSTEQLTPPQRRDISQSSGASTAPSLSSSSSSSSTSA